MNALNKLLTLLENDHIFLTGGAGVGKSYLTKEVIAYYKREYQGVVVLGSTGIAAVNVGGQTIHSFFVFGISSTLEELQKSDRYNKNRLKELCKLLQKTDLLIIDEISMVSSDLMEMLLYRLRQCDFKGRLMVVGDFYQLPPVQKKSQPLSQNILTQSQGLYAFESSAWEFFNFKVVELKKIKRTRDAKFMQILEKIRLGEVDQGVFAYLQALRGTQFDNMDEATMLFGTNAQADRLNAQKIAALNRPEVVLPSEVEIKDTQMDVRRIASWKKNLPIVEDLVLKEGIPVIFTTNKWGSYHNGERAIVEHIDKDSVVVEKGGKLIKVDRFEFTLSRSVVGEDGMVDDEVVCSLYQYPLRPAYAITIHKSQGMSLQKLICNVDTIFADSQFYVALSRAIDPKSLQIVYSRGDFEAYLRKSLSVSARVKTFYQECQSIVLD